MNRNLRKWVQKAMRSLAFKAAKRECTPSESRLSSTIKPSAISLFLIELNVGYIYARLKTAAPHGSTGGDFQYKNTPLC